MTLTRHEMIYLILTNFFYENTKQSLTVVHDVTDASI